MAKRYRKSDFKRAAFLLTRDLTHQHVLHVMGSHMEETLADTKKDDIVNRSNFYERIIEKKRERGRERKRDGGDRQTK